jgi:hypothetical protein
MRTIIAGSRGINDYDLLLEAIKKSEFEITKVISGGAYGVDKLGERYAKENNIELEVYPANWAVHGRSAGYKRNVEMAEVADALIALWDGASRGAESMISIAREKKLKGFVKIIK